MKKFLMFAVSLIVAIPGSLLVPAAVLASVAEPDAEAVAAPVEIEMDGEATVITTIDFEGDVLVTKNGPRQVFTDDEGSTLTVHRK